jgi:hypothetical protein
MSGIGTLVVETSKFCFQNLGYLYLVLMITFIVGLVHSILKL